MSLTKRCLPLLVLACAVLPATSHALACREDGTNSIITQEALGTALAVAADTHVVGPTGRHFTPQTIGMAMAMRDLKQHLRETGESKGYNASFSPRDRSAFLSALDQAARRALRALSR